MSGYLCSEILFNFACTECDPPSFVIEDTAHSLLFLTENMSFALTMSSFATSGIVFGVGSLVTLACQVRLWSEFYRSDLHEKVDKRVKVQLILLVFGLALTIVGIIVATVFREESNNFNVVLIIMVVAFYSSIIGGIITQACFKSRALYYNGELCLDRFFRWSMISLGTNTWPLSLSNVGAKSVLLTSTLAYMVIALSGISVAKSFENVNANSITISFQVGHLLSSASQFRWAPFLFVLIYQCQETKLLP